MPSRVDAQVNYELKAAERLKKKGNEFHSQGRFSDALEKYKRAKNNLKNVPSSKGATLVLACSLNLMSCYLKTGQYDECINEGTEVLATDTRNVKALYRRGEAYKSLGQLQKAVSDLSKAHGFSPKDKLIADALRDTKNKLIKQGIRIEEITALLSEKDQTSSSTLSDDNKDVTTQARTSSNVLNDDMELIRFMFNILCNTTIFMRFIYIFFNIGTIIIKKKKKKKKNLLLIDGFICLLNRFFHFISQADPKAIASLGDEESESLSPEMIKIISDMISKMPPDVFQKMVQGEDPLLNRNNNNNKKKKKNSVGQRSSIDNENNNAFEGLLSSRNAPQPSFPSSSSDIRSQLKNPDMCEMKTSMMKDTSPDMLANMSQQFGVNLSEKDEDAEMEQFGALLENLDRLMKWAARIQRTVEVAVKTKNWLMGRKGLITVLCMLVFAVFLHWQGLIMALCMLIFAVLLHWLGYIGRLLKVIRLPKSVDKQGNYVIF
ncbi:outer envelope protein 61-like [Rutidosis leptorrhynchoides]|uniref:outer envelope protein 61-like n=1 Tax=Rutidosis leptorrhynchoides TaxID=125765 RepID=UPI003A9A5125